MQTYSLGRRLVSLLAGAWLAVNLCHPALAQVFTIDTNQSSITISGSIEGNTFNEQGPGSLTTSYGGTLQTALAAGTIQFTGQSLILAQTNGTWEPKADGSAGSEPANYGATASSSFATVKAALRKVQLDVTSPVINVVGGQFDASTLVFSFPASGAGTFAYNVTGLIGTSGTKALSGYATNGVASQATLAGTGNQQTLTIPVDATFQFTLLSANDATVRVKGKFVATSTATPPPAIQSLKVQAGTVTLQWQSAPGEHFQVRSSADFKIWQTNALDVTSATSTYTWSGPATPAHLFFRIVK